MTDLEKAVLAGEDVALDADGSPEEIVKAVLISLSEPSDEVVETVAKELCAQIPGGFCRDVGGYLGCKNGRGLMPCGQNCKANGVQLELSGTTSMAKAAIRSFIQAVVGDQ